MIIESVLVKKYLLVPYAMAKLGIFSRGQAKCESFFFFFFFFDCEDRKMWKF